jgi:hypothetical protein
MTITQTVEIPADRRILFEFLAPEEIPAGPARLELKVIPVAEKPMLKDLINQPTPRADSLLGILSHVGDISLEEIRAERLAKYLNESAC